MKKLTLGLFLILVSSLFFIFFSKFPLQEKPVLAQTSYQQLGKVRVFGGEEGKYPYSPWVMHEPDWESYLIYFSDCCKDSISRIESWTDGKTGWDWDNRLKVIEGGVNSEDEDYLSASPGVVIDSQGTWHMYYVTANGLPEQNMILYLHHATAQAPGISWTKLGRIQIQGVDQPFYSPDYIETPSPLFINGQIVLYYPFNTIDESGKLKGRLMRTTSTDGHHFSTPVEVNIADDPVQAGHVKYINGIYYYVYSRNPTDPYQYSTHIYISTSTDGIHFSEGILLFHAESFGWDSWRAWAPDLLIEDKILRVYYAGAKYGVGHYNIGLRWFLPPCQDDDGICPEGCTPENDSNCIIEGDLNGDGQVNSQDLKILLENWGDPSAKPEADLNVDGVVNGIDFGKLVKLISVSK